MKGDQENQGAADVRLDTHWGIVSDLREVPQRPQIHVCCYYYCYYYYLDCFHPSWLFDLIVHNRPVFIHGLVPCSHTNCVLTQEKQREKTLQNCQFLCSGKFSPRTKADLRAQGKPSLPQPLCQEPIIALYIADSGMNVSCPESDSCLTTEILLLAFWKPLECARR